MLASLLAPALLLLASAAVAQETPSVVTSISISPTPTTEEAFTIQTSVPGSSDGLMSIPAGETPLPTSVASIITDPLLTSATGVMSIPPGETPLLPSSVASIITDPLLSSVAGSVSVPTGETPISTPSLNTTATLKPTSSATGSGLPEQTTNAAAPALKADTVPFVLALAFALL